MIAGLKNRVGCLQIAFLDASTDGPWRVPTAKLSNNPSNRQGFTIDFKAIIMLSAVSNIVNVVKTMKKHPPSNGLDA